jgi:D-3-phosphoglycerate dehydrogenase / 2-oxoglutarate reductase
MASQAHEIALSRQLSNSISVSTSPEATFHTPPWVKAGPPSQKAKQLKPFDSKGIKILLLENVNQSGKDILTKQGYQVEALKSSLPEDQLIEKIRYENRVPRNPLTLLT